MKRLLRHQVLFEHWQTEEINKLSREYDLSICSTLRALVNYALANINSKSIRKTMLNNDAPFIARCVVEKRRK